MSLNELEQHVYAYYVAHDAAQFTLTDRFFPHGELVLVIADKIQVATRKFGRQATSKSNIVAAALLDKLIASGAYSTKQNDFGGTMHQFQGDAYKAFLKAEQDSDPVIAKAQAGGTEFWEQAFAALVAK